jgi:hypothetical protein
MKRVILLGTTVALLSLTACSGTIASPPPEPSNVDSFTYPAGLVTVTRIETMVLGKAGCSQERLASAPAECGMRLTAGQVLTVVTPRDDTAWDGSDGSGEDPESDAEPEPEPEPPVVAPPLVRETRSWPSVPKYKPAGRARSYALAPGFVGYAAHWDYCKPFTYMINPDRMPPALRADVVKAVSRFGAATGIWFEYAGETDVLPLLDPGFGSQRESSGQTLVVAVSDKRTYPILRGSVAGIGGQSAVGSAGSTSMAFQDGGVVIDADALGGLRRGFGPVSHGALLLHELGHVAGLAHVDDETQVMDPVMSRTAPGRYGAGDLAGFAVLSAMGCFPPEGT